MGPRTWTRRPKSQQILHFHHQGSPDRHPDLETPPPLGLKNPAPPHRWVLEPGPSDPSPTKSPTPETHKASNYLQGNTQDLHQATQAHPTPRSSTPGAHETGTLLAHGPKGQAWRPKPCQSPAPRAHVPDPSRRQVPGLRPGTQAPPNPPAPELMNWVSTDPGWHSSPHLSIYLSLS